MILRIKKLLNWVPVLWKDEDWDYVYLFKIMRLKLQSMEDLHEYHGIAVDSKKTAKEIRTAKLLLDRIIKDEYLENSIDNKNHANLLEISRRMQRQDLDLFCKILRKKSLGWWE